jgi:endoglucanase
LKTILLFISLAIGGYVLNAQNFNKGVNVTGWFQANAAREIQFTMFTKTDFEQIKALGCDVVRLPINLHAMTNGAPDYTLDPLFLNMLDQVVDWSEELQIHLILDNHTFDPAGKTSPSIQDPLVKVWTQMAQHFANRSSYLYYEILNEPHGIDESTWATIQQSAINAIRLHDTQHHIVVGGANWNSYTSLASLPVYADTKLIYTFHFYDPFIFTHQGASWTDPSLVPLSGVPFPYRSSSMPGVPTTLRGTWIESAMNNYSAEGTAAKVKQLIDIAAAFKSQRNVPVFCGEFGVYIPNSNNDDRTAWYELVRTYLTQKGISWTTWDYKGGFGLFEKNSNELYDYDLNIPLVQALGFTAPPQEDFVKTARTTDLMIYDDYIGQGLINASYAGGGVLDFYSENNPESGDYCMYWTNVGQYDAIAMDFKPDVDLSKLKDHNFELVFNVKGNTTTAKFDVRFIDSKASGSDHPWRMGKTLDQSVVPMDGQWHEVRLPLQTLTEKGSWDNAWFEPQGLFDWTSVDRFEIVPEHQPLTGIEFWFDDIRVEGEDIILSTGKTSSSGIKSYPNPFTEKLTIEIQSPSANPVIYISNILGTEVKRVPLKYTTEEIKIEWNGRDNDGQLVAPGMYFICIKTQTGVEVIKVMKLN